MHVCVCVCIWTDHMRTSYVHFPISRGWARAVLQIHGRFSLFRFFRGPPNRAETPRTEISVSKEGPGMYIHTNICTYFIHMYIYINMYVCTPIYTGRYTLSTKRAWVLVYCSSAWLCSGCGFRVYVFRTEASPALNPEPGAFRHLGLAKSSRCERRG